MTSLFINAMCNVITCILSIVAKPPIIFPQLLEQNTDIEETIVRLQELDPTLTTLNLNNHPRLEEDLFQQLCDALVANTYLTTLELAGTKLGDNHAKVSLHMYCIIACKLRIHSLWNSPFSFW